MEYSKENVMTRKEYLKSKKNRKFDFSKFKYVLLFVVIVLLSIYLYKQLNLYNNVTKIANKVVEETALAKTMTMYYIQDSYTKDEKTSVMIYKSFDESRTKIENTEGFTDICLEKNNLYGIKENKLYKIDLETKELIKVTDKNVKSFIVKNNIIYYYVVDKKDPQNTGVYKIDLNISSENQIIAAEIFDMDITEKHIYIVSKGTTNRSVLRYDLEGKNKKEISEKYIISGIRCIEDKVYFTTTKNNKLYVIDKNKSITKITNNKIKNIKDVVEYNGNVYYINSSDNNTLYVVNSKTDERVLKKNIIDLQIDRNVIYFRIEGSIGIYKFDTETKNTAQVTSARTNKYICKN